MVSPAASHSLANVDNKPWVTIFKAKGFMATLRAMLPRTRRHQTHNPLTLLVTLDTKLVELVSESQVILQV